MRQKTRQIYHVVICDHDTSSPPEKRKIHFRAVSDDGCFDKTGSFHPSGMGHLGPMMYTFFEELQARRNHSSQYVRICISSFHPCRDDTWFNELLMRLRKQCRYMGMRAVSSFSVEQDRLLVWYMDMTTLSGMKACRTLYSMRMSDVHNDVLRVINEEQRLINRLGHRGLNVRCLTKNYPRIEITNSSPDQLENDTSNVNSSAPCEDSEDCFQQSTKQQYNK